MPLAVHMWPLLTTRVLSVFVFLLADFSWVTRSVCTCRLTLPSREGGGPKAGGNQCHLDGSCTPIHTPGPWQLRPGSPVSQVPWKRAGASSRAKGSLQPSTSSWRSVSLCGNFQAGRAGETRAREGSSRALEPSPRSLPIKEGKLPVPGPSQAPAVILDQRSQPGLCRDTSMCVSSRCRSSVRGRMEITHTQEPAS